MFAYSTPEERPLSQAERDFLAYLLGTYAPNRLGALEDLSVIARCGCGECPGILFAPSLDSQPITEQAYLVVDVITSSQPNAPIGVMLWGTDSRLIELEFCSYGDSDVIELPAVADLKPFAAA